MPCTDAKSIYRKMQSCADRIAISESDLVSYESIDEIYDDICEEIMPELIKQLGYMQGLREELRMEKHKKC